MHILNQKYTNIPKNLENSTEKNAQIDEKFNNEIKDINKKLSDKNEEVLNLKCEIKINDISKDLVLLSVQTNSDIMDQYLQDFIKLTDTHFDKFFLIDKYDENNNETESSSDIYNEQIIENKEQRICYLNRNENIETSVRL
jgi:hypothetical protein